VRQAGSAPLVLEPRLLAQLLGHARQEAPRECCGVLWLDRPGGGQAPASGPALVAAAGPLPLRYHRTRNRASSPNRYEMDPDDLLAILDGLTAEDASLWGLFHSHVRHEALPSEVDRTNAYYPDAIYLILSLKPGADLGRGLTVEGAALRGFRIWDGEVEEVALTQAGLGGAPPPLSTDYAS